MLQLKIQGSLCWQAERKESPSTLIPDVDNAAVGNVFTLLQEDSTLGILLLFISLRKEKRTEGERPEPCNTAMGSRVPA